jgi:hypothetical protein
MQANPHSLSYILCLTHVSTTNCCKPEKLESCSRILSTHYILNIDNYLYKVNITVIINLQYSLFYIIHLAKVEQ